MIAEREQDNSFVVKGAWQSWIGNRTSAMIKRPREDTMIPTVRTFHLLAFHFLFPIFQSRHYTNISQLVG